MNKVLKSIWGILVFIAGLVAVIFVGGKKKPNEIKQLDKVIKKNKKVEKETAKELKKLQLDKAANKKEIANLKRKITKTKNEIQKMEDAYSKDNVEDAVKFLKRFASMGN